MREREQNNMAAAASPSSRARKAAAPPPLGPGSYSLRPPDGSEASYVALVRLPAAAFAELRAGATLTYTPGGKASRVAVGGVESAARCVKDSRFVEAYALGGGGRMHRLGGVAHKILVTAGPTDEQRRRVQRVAERHRRKLTAATPGEVPSLPERLPSPAASALMPRRRRKPAARAARLAPPAPAAGTKRKSGPGAAASAALSPGPVPMSALPGSSLSPSSSSSSSVSSSDVSDSDDGRRGGAGAGGEARMAAISAAAAEKRRRAAEVLRAAARGAGPSGPKPPKRRRRAEEEAAAAAAPYPSPGDQPSRVPPGPLPVLRRGLLDMGGVDVPREARRWEGTVRTHADHEQCYRLYMQMYEKYLQVDRALRENKEVFDELGAAADVPDVKQRRRVQATIDREHEARCGTVDKMARFYNALHREMRSMRAAIEQYKECEAGAGARGGAAEADR